MPTELVKPAETPANTLFCRPGLSRNYLILMGLVLTLAITIRVVLYFYFPIFLTDDSGNYLAASHAIAYNRDFQTAALGDWRMPGYPVFLALTVPLTHMHSNQIVLLQNLVGVLCVVLGMVIGWQVGSRFLSIALGLFLAVNPVYLLFEHMLLSESLFLLALMGFLTIWIVCWQSQTWSSGLLLGLISAAGILIRSNSMVFFGACVLGIYLVRLSWPLKRTIVRKMLPFTSGMVIGLALFLAPWIWRNYQMYNNLSITNLAYRNSFFLKGMLGHLDTNLPIYQEISHEIGIQEFGYPWLNTYKKIYPTNEAEEIAQRLLFEQIRYHPIHHLIDILDNFLCFGGICRYPSGERASITYWLQVKLTQPDAIRELGTVAWAKLSNPDYVFVDTRTNPLLLLFWSKTGVFYLSIFRPLLFLGFLVLAFKLLRGYRVNQNNPPYRQYLYVLFLGVAYIFLALTHALTMAGLDRYAVPFDISVINFIILSYQTNASGYTHPRRNRSS